MINTIPDEILDAANTLFAQRGYDGTSLQLIADAVGIRKPSLLYHFSSKEVLRDAVLARVMEHWNDVLPSLLNAATGEHRFDALVGEMVAFFADDPSRARLLYREFLDRPAEMATRMHEFLSPWISILADYVRRGQAEGLLRPDVDAEAYVANVIQMIVGGVATAHVFGVLNSGSSFDQQIKEITRTARTALFIDNLEISHG
ncbi:MAG: TetR/AcrR family transcriptional regulator [bacterium]